MSATVGAWPSGNSTARLQAEVRAGQAQLVLAHFVEEARAIAEDHGHARHRIPDHVAKAAQAGELGADAVPVGVEGDVVGRADGEQALRVGRDGAGVGDVELKRCAGRERVRQRHGCLVQLAGVVGVGVERGHLEARRRGPRCGCAPS